MCKFFSPSAACGGERRKRDWGTLLRTTYTSGFVSFHVAPLAAQHERKKDFTMFNFDPDRVAYFEANGWRAYYDRKWLKMLRLIVGLCQEQFHIPFPMSLLAAYYTTRASLAWVPVDHDEQKVLAFLEKFYRLARRYSGLKF